MQEKNHHIKIDGELLHQYHHGELENEQKNEIEKLALNDAFVSDALDGFEQDPNAMLHLEQLQHKLFLKTKQKRKGIGFYIKPYYPHMAVAATLFVLVFSGYFILINSSDDGKYTAKNKNLVDTTTQIAKVDVREDEGISSTTQTEKISSNNNIQSVDPVINSNAPNEVMIQQESADVQEDVKENTETEVQKQKEADIQSVNPPKEDDAIVYKTIPRTEAVALSANTEIKPVAESDNNKKNVVVANAVKVKTARPYGNTAQRNATENSIDNNDTKNEMEANDAFKLYMQNHPLRCYDASGVEIKGEVKLRFNVDKNGKPEKIKVIQSLSASCDQMAIDQVKSGYSGNATTNRIKEEVVIKF